MYREYADRHQTAPISANFRPKAKKFQLLNHLSIYFLMGKNPSHANVPLTGSLSPMAFLMNKSNFFRTVLQNTQKLTNYIIVVLLCAICRMRNEIAMWIPRHRCADFVVVCNTRGFNSENCTRQGNIMHPPFLSFCDIEVLSNSYLVRFCKTSFSLTIAHVRRLIH
jgi:hypothetical protein